MYKFEKNTNKMTYVIQMQLCYFQLDSYQMQGLINLQSASFQALISTLLITQS
jgi:hypothetical protein